MIKIITLLGNNYGGCLQAIALQKVLKKYDSNVETINYVEYMNTKKNAKTFIKSIVYKNRNKKFNEFRSKHLKLTSKVVILEDDETSKYIVGSDQIWNPNINYEIRKNFYLAFVKDNKRKFAYAASIGDNILDYNKENEKCIIELLNRFKSISVRESSTVEILTGKINQKIYNVVDPTFLLTKKEWDKYKNKNNNSNYALVYMLGIEKNVIKNINNNINDDIMEISYKKNFKKTKYVENNYGPSEFIGAIDSSKYVITNSFHGMVFSIIYHKDFYVILRDTMNSRIYDLLHKLNLTDRIITKDNIEDKLKVMKKIDYNKVDIKLEKMKKDSIKYIKSIFEKD